MKTYTKLIGIATAVATITGYTFTFSNYASKDSWIREGVNRLKQVALGYKAQLEELQGRYNNLLADLDSTADALAKAEAKLKQVYEAIVGEAWNDENGSILDFDFSSILPDEPLPDNPVDGGAIAEILGLPSDATTQDILNAITDLIDTVRTLEERITVLESQVASLEAEISEYEGEQDSLVQEINALKNKLDEATERANEIISNASEEEEAQLDYVNDTLTELGEEPIVPTVERTEEAEAAWNNYVTVAQAKGWNDEYTNGFVNGTMYPEIVNEYGNYAFYIKSTADNSVIKKYDSASNDQKAIAEAYTAYLASMNS